MELFTETTTAITLNFPVLLPVLAGIALFLKHRSGLQVAFYRTGFLAALAWSVWTLAEIALPLRWPYFSATLMYFLASISLFFATLFVWGYALKTSPVGSRAEDYPVIIVFAVWLANVLIAPLVKFTWAFSQAVS
ncbi:hypothetical protein N6L27_03995 [Leisingera sp. SS27]|uniref:hypothetical protein n=1 Tax=Leisingera sp. SS27 TaxID=2979462 RepID=UPI00232DDDD1|nr:hypothetical protein [Leisingera sp. SS27]MDC0657152.1 hypothetical protein [Leisingera sp. SS27]